MSPGRRKKQKRRVSTLRYLTIALVLCAIAWVGYFFYTHNVLTALLPALNRLRGEAPPSAWTATLYFGDETGERLLKEHRIITSSQTPERKAAALLQELLKGPISRGTRTLPPQTRESGVAFDSGIMSVNFSAELKTKHPGGSAAEILTVYAIVDTLAANIPEVKKVQLLIDGKPIDTLAGHIDCKKPMAPRTDLIR
jgi:hypothetical protein